jgi:hypothetical protein
MPRTQFGGPPKEIWEAALQTRSLVKRARNEVARTRLPLFLALLVCNLALFSFLRATGARARRKAGRRLRRGRRAASRAEAYVHPMRPHFLRPDCAAAGFIAWPVRQGRVLGVFTEAESSGRETTRRKEVRYLRTLRGVRQVIQCTGYCTMRDRCCTVHGRCTLHVVRRVWGRSDRTSGSARR